MNLVAVFIVSLFFMTLVGKRASEPGGGIESNMPSMHGPEWLYKLTCSKGEYVEEAFWRKVMEEQQCYLLCTVHSISLQTRSTTYLCSTVCIKKCVGIISKNLESPSQRFSNWLHAYPMICASAPLLSV